MKTISSSILQEGKPVSKTRALALAFIDQNKEPIKRFLETKKKDLEENAKLILFQKNRNPWKELTLYLLSGALYLITGIAILFFENESLPINKFLAFGILLVCSIGIFSFSYFYRLKKIIEDIAKNIENLEKLAIEISTRKPDQMLSHLGTVNFLTGFHSFESDQILLDKSGVMPMTDFTFPDIPVAGNFGEIKNYMDNMPEQLPTILSNKHNLVSEGVELLGIESDIDQSLSKIGYVIDQKTEVKANLPLFDKDSKVVKSIQRLESYSIDSNEDLLTFKKETDIEKSIQTLSEINDNAKEAKAKGSESDEAFLLNSIEFIKNKIGKVNSAREHSIQDVLGEGIERLYPILDYPLTTFYCPECLQVPEYLRRKQKVSISNLYEANDYEIRKLPNSEKIIQLKNGADARKRYLDFLKVSHQEDSEAFFQVNDELKSIEQRLIELVTVANFIDPMAEVTRHNAVLKYNIINKHWKCELCNSTFTDEEAKFGRILKVKDQLFYPIWDNLWLEKHDEHNRIIKDKETEIRGNKNSESTQIRSETDVFTQEYREARNFLDEAASLYDSSMDEFNKVASFLVAMKIVSPNKIIEIKENLFKEGGSLGPSDIIKKADLLEIKLEQEPETVFLRRKELEDYTIALRNFDKFYKLQITENTVLALDKKEQLALEEYHG